MTWCGIGDGYGGGDGMTEVENMNGGVVRRGVADSGMDVSEMVEAVEMVEMVDVVPATA